MMIFRLILGLVRSVLVFTLIILCVITATVRTAFLGFNLLHSLRIRSFYLRLMLLVMGVKIVKRGNAVRGNYIYIANHRTYLDPAVMLLDIDAMPVAKAEVSSWPIIGYGAKATGILYVKRESKESRTATRQAIKETLQQGDSILIFPEGTTNGLPKTIAFKIGTFAMAAENNFEIAPIMIDYNDEELYWLGADTFMPHFIKICSKWRSVAYVEYGEPISGTDPVQLLQKTKDWIDNRLAHLPR